MITRCPSCQTHFRVHAEQLAVRAGRVRCGKCGQVFDALEYLIEEAARAAEPVTPKPAAAAGVAAPAAKPAPIAAAPTLAEAPRPPNAPAAAPTPRAAVAIPEMEKPEPVLDTSVSLASPSASEAGGFDFGPAAESARQLRRWPWALGALLLLLALLAQTAYYFRSAIIVLLPELKPYASSLCATLHCDLPLPQRVEMMSIEASDLQADTTNPNIMVLSATLRNRATFEQQLPMLELTLTDAQDQPVVRRVLAPRDYLPKSAKAVSAFGANAEIAIKVFIEGSQVKATGYRLYLFYP